jgi:hypothetical protein
MGWERSNVLKNETDRYIQLFIFVPSLLTTSSPHNNLFFFCFDFNNSDVKAAEGNTTFQNGTENTKIFLDRKRFCIHFYWDERFRNGTILCSEFTEFIKIIHGNSGRHTLSSMQLPKCPNPNPNAVPYAQ